MYNHPIMPLCDVEDRHTQIIWGLREFAHRFGRPAQGIWLSETAIDMNTVRALITHGVKFTILAPQQAAMVRPFDSTQWQDVHGGAIDTRHPYRVFEVDGAGRTHFDRYLDIMFYNPGLSLKVSFDHLMNDPAKLKQEILTNLDPAAELPQVLTLATDGEIYGHHEAGADAGLAGLFTKIAQDCGICVTTPAQYLAENPPSWEVKLDAGIDGKGSSWSCEHGVGRWWTDCGCNTGGGSDWNQQWAYAAA